MQQLWEPKDLLRALKGHEEVNLRHIATRRDKGLLTPDVKAGHGERPKYGAYNALLYCVATKLENAGFSIELAYKSATSILTHNFCECMLDHEYLWLIAVDKMDAFTCQNILNSADNFTSVELQRDGYVLLIPIAGVYLYIPKTKYDTFTDKESIRFYNASKIVFDAVMELGINDEEIEKLKRD
jgi:hypothetical protein